MPECFPGVDCKESFPLAEGYGSVTVGGRCSDVVLVVDDLSDLDFPPTPNTLRWAVEHADHAGLSRTIVFNVSGIITLSRPITFQQNDSHITIAGETAPGGGIVITNYGFHLLGAHDIIIRHLRFRNIRAFEEVVEPELIPGTVGDGIEIEGSERIMIDHVSVSWATDEGIGAEGAVLPMGIDDTDITIQNSYVAETLWNGDHPDPNVSVHSRAMIVSDGSDRASLHHNYLHSNNQRNPSLQGTTLVADCPDPSGPGGEIVDSRWNLVYNWGDSEPGCDPELQNCAQRTGNGAQFGQGIRANLVGSWVREGPDTAFTSGRLPIEAVDRCERNSEIFLECNCRILRNDPSGPDEIWCPGNDDQVCPGIDGEPGSQPKELVGGAGMISCNDGECVTFLGGEIPDPPGVTERPDVEMDVFTYLLNRGGALPPDHWDRKFRRQYRAYQGELAGIRDDCIDQGGTKDECGDEHDDLIEVIDDNPPAPGTQWADSDGDMIDDAWEEQHPNCYCLVVDGINCFDTDDALEDCDLDGWTDLEEWLHGRAAELERAVVFADEFEDWKTPDSWLLSANEWEEREGYLVGTREDSDALAEFDGILTACDGDCTVSATLRATDTTGAAEANVRLLAWREPGIDTFHAVSLKPHAGAAGQVVIERRTNGALNFQCTIETPVAVDADYDVRIEYASPSTTGAYRVYFNPTTDEETFLAACGQGVDPVPGTVGVGSFQADVRAGRIAAVRTD